VDAIVLQADEDWPVVVVDGSVRRRRSWWTPSVHDLLSHLADRGFTASPRPLGFDGENREMLSFIEGESGRSAGRRISRLDALANFACLLRRYHDAVRDYVPPADADWALPASGGATDVICHGDFAPWNAVWIGDVPVGIIDFDLAHPGRALEDVAYALAYSVPFRDDDDSRRMLGVEAIPDRCERVEVFARAYGIDVSGLAERVAARQLEYARDVELLRARGFRVRWTSEESIERNYAIADWVAAHQHLFE
jgi:aminoglycoside phosphotransferase (APT) family kinase protein